MAKKAAVLIKLVSMAGTGWSYVTKRSGKKQTKLLLKKYDPIVNQHVLFKEEKISRSRQRK